RPIARSRGPAAEGRARRPRTRPPSPGAALRRRPRPSRRGSSRAGGRWDWGCSDPSIARRVWLRFPGSVLKVTSLLIGLNVAGPPRGVKMGDRTYDLRSRLKLRGDHADSARGRGPRPGTLRPGSRPDRPAGLGPAGRGPAAGRRRGFLLAGRLAQ